MLENNQIKVSVIIPIYKVEKYIQRCAESLFKQTLPEVEYIFVNDCTPDNSMNILQECIECYPNRKNNISVYNHKVNKGLPGARNTGLLYAKGEYIFHCDSDDFVDPLMLEEMYNCAKLKNADIVWTDWFLSYEQNERYMQQPSYSNANDALYGILNGSMKFNVWNKLVRRELYSKNNIIFPAGRSMGEDMTMIKLFACALGVAYLQKAYYHYVKTNTSALTYSLTAKQLDDIQYNVNDVVIFLQSRLNDENKEKTISFFKLSIKLPFIISDKNSDYKLWNMWYPEANKYILANKATSLRIKILQWCAWKKIYLINWLYYKLIHKLVYGIIFR